MSRILVTGATGFIGRTLCEVLARSGHLVRAALRTESDLPGHIAEKCVVGDIGSHTQWSEAVREVDCVVHAAARVHVMHDAMAEADRYMETNVRGTVALATACAKSGVRRFVFLSSIKVNGEATAKPFVAQDVPHPTDDYGLSKWQAEQALSEIAQTCGMQVCAVRLPLVYGPGVRANFLSMLVWVHRGLPLPLGSVTNARSMVSIWNLCDLIRCVIETATLPPRVLMVSDGSDLSTPEIIRRLAAGMGTRARLMSVPPALLRLAGALTGRSAEISRLLGSLQVDVTATCNALNWVPPLSVDAGLAQTAQWFVKDRQARAT